MVVPIVRCPNCDGKVSTGMSVDEEDLDEPERLSGETNCVNCGKRFSWTGEGIVGHTA